MRSVLIILLLGFVISVQGADKKRKKASIYIDTIDMLGTPDPDYEDKQFKPIKEIVEKSKKYPGLFNIYQDTATGKVYLEITEDKLGKEFIYFQQIVNGVIDARFAKGGYEDNKIFKLSRYFDRIDFEIQNTGFYFNPENAISRAANANINVPLFLTEKIAYSSLDSAGKRIYLVEGDALFLKETISQIKPSASADEKDAFKLGGLSDKKGKYTGIFNYGENTDVQVSYVFENQYPTNTGGEQVTDARFVSVEVRHSLIAMPENNYKPRFDDPRVGYFIEQVNDMTSTSTTPYRDVIHRWHLEKKDPNAAISEPVQPIVWWIENTTPVELRPIIKDAALQWNKAFESAGFKNAIEIYEQPDTATWDAGDIRYNVLRWVSSPKPPYGGYGPSFVNPRTGQILGADIMLEWIYMSNRVRQEDLYEKAGMAEMEDAHDDKHSCQAGLYNQMGRAYGSTVMQAMGFADIEERELLKQALYSLILHELGHTLGLNHNFAGSLLNSPEQLQDKQRATTVGLTSSVMDYSPPSLSLDRTRQGVYYDVIAGPYDHWAIEYGYRQFSNEAEEKAGLQKILARSAEPALRFFNDADDMRSSNTGINPQAMLFDMSADPITDAINKINIIQTALKKLKDKFSKEGQSYHELRNAYVVLSNNYTSALRVLSCYIGGVIVDRSFVGQKDDVKPLTPVSAADQKRAMDALAKYGFSKDAFKNDSLLAYLQMQRRGYEFNDATEDPKELDRIFTIHKTLLNQLLHPEVLRRIATTQLYGNEYTLTNVLADLTKAVIKEDIAGSVNIYRQSLQLEYLNRVISILKDKSIELPAIRSAAYGEINSMKTLLQASANTGDQSTKYHRLYMLQVIKDALEK